MLKATIASCLALLAPAGADAATRYAEPGGNGPAGAGGCPSNDPCDIQAAVENAAVANNDVVLLKAGPYNLGSDQLLVDDDITIEPEPGLPRQVLNTTFSGAGGAVTFDSAANNALIRRIQISHDDTGGISTGLFLNAATGERLYVVSDGFFGCGVLSGTIRDSVCFLTANAIATAIGAVGISAGGAFTATSRLRNVTAVSKALNAPAVTLSAGAGANLTIDAKNVIAESSNFDVLANAGAGSIATITLGNSSFPTFDAAGAGGSVTPNTASGNQAVPAAFVNFAGNDFHQAPTSPTIDAGATDAFLGAFDVDGGARVLQGRGSCPPGALPDIGAYEAPAVPPALCPADPVTSPGPVTQPGGPKVCKKAKKRKKPKARASAKKKRKGCGKRKPKRKRV